MHRKEEAMARSKSLGATIRAGREAKGMSVRGLADATDLAPSSVLRFENDERRPSAAVVRRLARVLGLDTTTLLELANRELPSFPIYLRTKYKLSSDAIAELESAFEEVSQRDAQRRRRS
jgi:transcriptional regulator with XRE-family HTH domain